MHIIEDHIKKLWQLNENCQNSKCIFNVHVHARKQKCQKPILKSISKKVPVSLVDIAPHKIWKKKSTCKNILFLNSSASLSDFPWLIA